MRIVTSNFLLLISVPLNVGILESLIIVNALLTSLGSLPDDRNLIEERFEAPRIGGTFAAIQEGRKNVLLKNIIWSGKKSICLEVDQRISWKNMATCKIQKLIFESNENNLNLSKSSRETHVKKETMGLV